MTGRPHAPVSLLLGLCLAVAGAEPGTWASPGLLASGPEAAAWTAKANTKVEIQAATAESAGPVLRFTIDPTEFAYGWVNRALPEADYAQAAGLHGFCRADQPGSLLCHLIFAGDSGEPSYFGAECGTPGAEPGAWLEFYLPFGGFLHERGPRTAFTPAQLGPAQRLQFMLALNGKTPAAIDVRDLRFVGGDEAAPLRKRLAREATARQLLPAGQVGGAAHPRLILTAANQRAIEARIAALPELAAARTRLLALAVAAQRQVSTDQPFGTVIDFTQTATQKGHERRGAFEGQLVPRVTPIEIMAAAYRLSGDAGLGRHAATALASMARQVTVDDPIIDEGFYYTRTFYVRALAFGYDWLWEVMTPEQRRDVAATLLGFVLDIHRQSQTGGWGRRPLHRVWNWDPGLMGACGIGMLALEGETRVGEKAILFDCRRHLRDYLTLGIDADGCGHEGPSYIGYGIGAGVDFIEALRQQGRGDLFSASNYQLIPPWLISETLPDGKRWNNLSDCGHGQAPSPVYAYACGRLAELAATEPLRPGERLVPDETRAPLDYLQQFSEEPGVRRLSYSALAGLMGWAWQTGPGRTPPAELDGLRLLAYLFYYRPCPVAPDPAAYLPLALHFRGRGLVVSRTGFGPEDWHLAVEAGPHAAGHDQSDKGTFTLRAYGADLAIDSGYGNDGDPLKSGSSFAHNVVLIDGRGQPMSYHNQSSGQITGFHHSALLDWTRIDAREAWGVRYDRDWTPSTTTPVERAERTLVFVRGAPGVPPYLVVQDDIAQDAAERDYTWQWHIPAAMAFETAAMPWRAVPVRSLFPVLRSPLEGNARAEFRFRVPTPGRYCLAGLVRAGGDDSGKSDSFLIQVDGGPNLTWDLNAAGSLAWSMVRDRASSGPDAFALAAGEHVVALSKREPQAELARLLVLPEGQAVPQAPDATPPGAVALSAADAVPGADPFPVIPPGTAAGPAVTLDVVPVRPLGGRIDTSWFETSREGSHPRLQYTVRSRDPRFVMVLLPRREGTAAPTVSAVEAEDSVGVTLRWGEIEDTLRFRRDAESGRTTADFARRGPAGPADWTSAAAR
jgi:hypothetical protein